MSDTGFANLKFKTIVPEPPVEDPTKNTSLIVTENLRLFYGASQALKNISMSIRERMVTAFIGPSGCGKSTLLRCFNRMNDLIDHVRIEGGVKIGGQNIHGHDVDVIELRKRVGMVFQKSNPFPKSIYENIAYALRLHGMKEKTDLDEAVEQSLRNAALTAPYLHDGSVDGLRQASLHRWHSAAASAAPPPSAAQIDDLQAFLDSLSDRFGARRPAPVLPIACP